MSNYQKPHPIQRDISHDLFALRELIVRTPTTNQQEKQFFSKQYAATLAGYKGERKVDHLLERMPFPHLHTIIPNFQTQSKFGTRYQMDTLIITNRYILLLEIKNIRGHIEFHDNPAQIIRTFEGIQEKLSCPIHQLERNKKALEQLIYPLSTAVPIYSAIVFCHSTAQISSYPKTTKILYKNQVDFFIEKLNTLPEKCTKQEFQKLIRVIKSANNNFKKVPLSARYSIDITKLNKGVFCIECEGPMESLPKSIAFQCSICKKTDANALTNSLLGLFGLIDGELSRQQLRFHLNLQSRTRLTNALTRMGCIKNGSAKAIRYSLPDR